MWASLAHRLHPLPDMKLNESPTSALSPLADPIGVISLWGGPPNGAQIFERRPDKTHALESFTFDPDDDRAAAAKLNELYAARGWERLIVFGDVKTARPLIEKLTVPKDRVELSNATPE